MKYGETVCNVRHKKKILSQSLDFLNMEFAFNP